MTIIKISNLIFKIVVNREDYNIEEYYNNLIFLEKKGILTFSDTNFKVLEKFFLQNGYKPEPLNLCFSDDKSIGLEVPKTWYLNRGKHALSIATYYNYLSFHGIVEQKNIRTFNKKITKNYGRIACIEIYIEKELKKFLKLYNIKYFGTPKTLTECIRYLEGWNIKKYPRLKGYATFSKFIELWSKNNFPKFKSSEWFLGKEKSNKLNKRGGTNVRKAVQYFWENYLLKKSKKISDEDIEIDILDGNKFSQTRQPKIILMSEDLFSNNNSEYQIFKNLTKKLSRHDMFISRDKNYFPQKNAEAASAIYPNSLIILIENDENMRKNFSLINPIKHSINTDVVIATKILRYIIENNYKI